MQTKKQKKSALKEQQFLPKKYYAGLTYKQKLARKKEIEKFGKMHFSDPKAYVGFKTNKFATTKRKSSYTAQWDRLFPGVKSLEDRAKVTGVPLKYIQESYNRALSAWRTGHRPGMTPQQWAYPRASSFLLCGKTYYTADSDLATKAKAESASARKWWSKQCKVKSYIN